MICKKCTNRQHSKSGYCLDHLPTKLRCTHMTRKGKRCRLPIVTDSDVCNCHLQTMLRGRGKGKFGWVYLFHTGFTDIYKIGRSVNPKMRLAELNSGNPCGKMLFAGFVGSNARDIESGLHTKYRELWINREFFTLNQDDISWIYTFLKSISTEWNENGFFADSSFTVPNKQTVIVGEFFYQRLRDLNTKQKKKSEQCLLPILTTR